MDGLGKAASLTPEHSPVGSTGDGQGAFENFLASAIATIITIIFSWRLLLDTQETSPPAIEAAAGKSEESKPGGHQENASKEELHKITQVDIDPRTVSKETLKSVASSEKPLQSYTGHDVTVTTDCYKTTEVANHVNTADRDNETGFGMTAKLADCTNMCVETTDQYLPAPGSASGNNNATPDVQNEFQGNEETLLLTSNCALESHQIVTSTAHIELRTGAPDSSGEEDTATEGDISSDSTLEFNECDDDADHSDSEASSVNNIYSDTDAREFYVVGDPLSDDDSESEYCVVFNSMLEAITEEDTDDMSEIEKEGNDKKNKEESDQVDSFAIPKCEHQMDDPNSDLDSAVNNDRLCDAELTSDTDRIDVCIDTDANEKHWSTSSVYGPIINTQRSLVIGPYRDRHSKFSQEQTILHGAGVNTSSLKPNELSIYKDGNYLKRSIVGNMLPRRTAGDVSYLDRARAIIWGFPEPINYQFNSQCDQKVQERHSVAGAHEMIDEPNSVLESENLSQMESNQSTPDKKTEEHRYDLDGNQSSDGRDIGEEKDFNINVSDDSTSIGSMKTGQGDRSSTNADSDLDSLTECFDQFKKVALNHLEQTTLSETGVYNAQSSSKSENDTTVKFSDDLNFRNIYHVTETGKDAVSSPADLSKTDFDNYKSLSDSEHSADIYGGSRDTHKRSDKSWKFDDAPLSATGRCEKPAQGFTFVRTTNIERNYVLRNTSKDKNLDESCKLLDDDKALSVQNMGEPSSFDNRNSTRSQSIWDDMPVQSQYIQHGISTNDEQNYTIEKDSQRQLISGPIAETTVGKFHVRPHPNSSQFISQHERGYYDQDQPKTTGKMYAKGSSEVVYTRNDDSSIDSPQSRKFQSNNNNGHDQRGRLTTNQQDSLYQHHGRCPEFRRHGFDPNYIQSVQHYSQNGHNNSDGPDHNKMVHQNLYHVDDLVDRETLDLSGNIVAHQNMHKNTGVPCHAVAVSSALARRGDVNIGETDPELPPPGSAVASTEATSDNPYIAVARATARAATVASANATAGLVAKDSDGPGSCNDISVVVSTSCTIKEGDTDFKNSTPKIAHPDTQESSQNRQLTSPQKKKMMITIEESQDCNRREYRTLECEVPKDIPGDVTEMISEAVKRIIASQSSLAHQKGNRLNMAIDQITRQVVSAYRESSSGRGEIPRYAVPPQKLALYDSPTVKGKAIPEFRAQRTSQTYYLPPRTRPSVTKSPSKDHSGRPGAYLSRVINKPGDPKKSLSFTEQEEKPIFYVTGKYPSAEKETNVIDDIVLKVITDKNMQPSVEHVLLSESESDIETPVMERKQCTNLKDIKEEDSRKEDSCLRAPPDNLEKTKKKKPARPKLPLPVRPSSEGLNYVPPESWSVCTGCPQDKDTDEINLSNVTSPLSSEKAIKGILKTRPRSTIENESDSVDYSSTTKSKSSDDLSNPSTYKPLPVSSSKVNNKDIPKKPYKSVLLTPIKKNEIKVTSNEVKSASTESPSDQLSETKKSFFETDSSSALSDIPVAIPNTKPTRIDIEFEKRKKEWRSRTPSPKNSVLMVDIDIDGSRANGNGKKARSRSVEDLKQKLSKAPLKAPSTDHIDKHWEGVSDRLSKSQERILSGGPRSRGDSFSSDISQSYSSGMRRSTSMGTLPGQFFSDKRSYTSLIETDLDTGISTEIPLIQETNIDEILTKSKSMTSLNTATSFRTYDIYSDDSRYRSSEMISNTSSNSSEREALNQIPIENNIGDSRSAHELRISNSLNKLSLPDWFRAVKPVQLVNTKIPPRTPYPSNEKQHSRPQLEILPSKPIIISHRVSRCISKSPNSSTCSTPVGEPPSFELPSNKLRQSRETSLSPIPIKSPEEVPPLPPKKETARDSYLKLKARSNPESWEPLSTSQSPTKYTATDASYKYTAPYNTGRSQQTDNNHHSKNRTSPKMSSPNYTQKQATIDSSSHQPGRQEETYTSQKYITVSTNDRSSVVSEPYAPKPSALNYLGQDSDSGVTSLERQKPDIAVYTSDKKTYPLGRTVSNLVRDLKMDTSQISPPHNSGIDTGSPDGLYERMMSTLENERQDIENKANEISSSNKSDTHNLFMDKGQKVTESNTSNRERFPVLSLNTSPGAKRRSFRANDSGRTEKEPEPTNVTVTLTRQNFRGDSKKEAAIFDVNRKGSHSLDEVLGELLAIPPPPGHPDDDPDEYMDGSDIEDETPKERNLKILKQATAHKSNEQSPKSPSSENMQEDRPDQTETEVDEETIIIQCRNTKCGKSTKLSEARKSYKTCHNCFTYYCSRDCRKEHWERHKRKCLFSRISSGCKHIVKKVQNSDTISEELSRIARTGYLTKGRGCVMLVFSSPIEADKFLMKGFQESQNPPNYANIKDVQEAAEVFGDHEQELVQMCKSYNPELKYVLEVAIVAGQKLPTWPIPRKDGHLIKKCAKLRLYSKAASKQAKKDEPETLVLTAVPGAEFTENMEEKKAREICFVNIQRQLRQKGVSLRHHYPHVYNKLCSYVANNEHFTPISLYPVDINSAKRFMCLIMPNSEPEVNWMYNPELLGDLDLHNQV